MCEWRDSSLGLSSNSHAGSLGSNPNGDYTTQGHINEGKRLPAEKYHIAPVWIAIDRGSCAAQFSRGLC